MITARIKSAERAQVAGRLTQWDVGQTIQVEGLSVSGVAYARMSVLRKSYATLTVECAQSEGVLTVEVPDVLLTSSGTLSVAIVDDTEDKAIAVARFEVPIEPAARPADYVPGSPALVTIEALRRRIELAESEASSAVSQASQALTDAETAYARAMEAAERAESTDSLVLANETLRVSAESERESAEGLRQSAEGERQSMEESREADEASRSSAEQARAESEAARVQAEKSRALAEQSRVAAENSRVQAESMRVAAEQARDDDWTSLRSDMASTFNADQSTRAQLFKESQDSRDDKFDASMGVYDANVEMAVQKAEIAASNANAAADNANTHAGNYLRGDESGVLVHVEDAWPSPAREVAVYGKSEQVTTTGKNLFDPVAFAAVQASTGYAAPTINADGSITTIESNSAAWTKLGVFMTLSAGTYTLSGAINVEVRDANNSIIATAGSQNEIKFTLSEETSIKCKIDYGLASYPVISFVQLEAGTVATDWEPYTGGKPSPSPEYPQEIASIADARVSACGKNVAELYGYSAVGHITSPSSKLVLTNLFGTTISTTDAVESLNVSQVANESVDTVSYNNGYFCIGVRGLDYGKEYVFSATISNLSNPLSATLWHFLANGTSVVGSIVASGRISVSILWNKSGGGYIEMRNSGCSFTISDIMLTPYEYQDTDYSPYVGSTTPNLLVSEDGTAYELRSLPDGTRDELAVMDGRKVLHMMTGRTSSAVTDGVTGTVGTDVMSSTGEIADGADVVYKLSTPETIDLGPADPIPLPETVSNVWPVSEPSTELALTYERDVTVAYSNLEQAIASITS